MLETVWVVISLLIFLFLDVLQPKLLLQRIVNLDFKAENSFSFGRVLLQIFLTSISFNVKVLTNKNRKENGNMNNVKQNNTQVYRMTELLSSKPL